MQIQKLTQPRYLFLLLLALSLSVRIGASLALGAVRADPSLLDVDEQEYYQYAGDLLQGKYEFNSRRTLGHIAVIALYRLLTFDHFVPTQLLATAVFSLAPPLMYLLVRRITRNNLVAAIVGLLVVFWPPYIYYGNSLYSETTALPLFTAFLLLLPRGSILTTHPDGSWRRWVGCGVLLGLCMLIRPMYLMFVPLAVLIVFLEELQWKTAFRRAGILLAGCFLVVLPWSIYMSTNAGTLVLVSANGGETISGGLNPALIEQGYQTFVAPDGRITWTGPGKWLPRHESGYLTQTEEQKLPYIEQDKLLKQRTLAWIGQHPVETLYLQAAKLLYMWGFYPLRFDKQTLLGSIPTILALVFSVASLMRFRHYSRHLCRFWILPLFVCGIALISWGSWRFRQPGDLGILTLSTLFLLSLFIQPPDLIRSPRFPAIHLPGIRQPMLRS